MKKSVKTNDDLNNFALKKGATVIDEHGKKINTGKAKMKIRPLPAKPKPAPPKKLSPPSPKPENNGDIEVAKAIEMASRTNMVMMGEIIKQIAQIKLEHPGHITDWTIDVIRDPETDLLAQLKIKAG